MPIYEYQCARCAHEFDVLQRMNDAPLSECPECGQAALTKLVSAPSFRLKGSGWYETDFKKDKRRNLADGGKPDAGTTDTKKDADTKVAKPDAKAAAGDTNKATPGKKKGSGDKAASA